MSLFANWSYPTAIRFGSGRISEIGGAVRAAGITRPLLVTDRGLASMDITNRTLDLLEAEGFERATFADVDPNPSDHNVAEGLRIYRSGGFDGVVAFGGGSGLDIGKTLAFMAGQTRPIWDFEDIDDWWTRANPDGIHPIVAVHRDGCWNRTSDPRLGALRSLRTPQRARRKSSSIRKCCPRSSFATLN